jgi:hypothetical protein
MSSCLGIIFVSFALRWVLGNCDKKINADGVVDISVATECVNTMCPQTSTMILNKESGTSNKGVIT